MIYISWKAYLPSHWLNDNVLNRQNDLLMATGTFAQVWVMQCNYCMGPVQFT